MNLVLHVNEHEELDNIHESLCSHPDSDVARMLSLSNLTVKSLLVDRIFQAIRLAERSESQEIQKALANQQLKECDNHNEISSY